MRDRWLTAPWWVRAFVMGGAFAALTGGASLVARNGPSLTWALVFGGVTGFVGGIQDARRSRALRELVGSDRAGTISAARRAAWRGPVPADPAVRAAALRIAEQRADEAQARRLPLVLLLLFVFVAEVALAMFYRPWLWLIVGWLAVVLACLVHAPDWYARRAEELRDPEHIRR
jgi:hypothetical protein